MMKTGVVMPLLGEFSKPDAYSKKDMVTCATYYRCLEQMEIGVSPEPKSETDIEKEDLKLCSW